MNILLFPREVRSGLQLYTRQQYMWYESCTTYDDKSIVEVHKNKYDEVIVRSVIMINERIEFVELLLDSASRLSYIM